MADRIQKINQLNSYQDRLASNKAEIQRLNAQRESIPDSLSDEEAIRRDVEISRKIERLEQDSKSIGQQRNQIADRLSAEDDFTPNRETGLPVNNNIGTDAAVQSKSTFKTVTYEKTTNVETVSGGGSTTTFAARPTEQQKQYDIQFAQAKSADTDARRAAETAYLEANGLPTEPGPARFKAIQEAKKSGAIEYPTSQAATLGERPAGGVAPDPLVDPGVNETTVSETTSITTQAKSQRAGTAVNRTTVATNDNLTSQTQPPEPPVTDGEEESELNADETLSEEEEENIDTADDDVEQDEGADTADNDTEADEDDESDDSSSPESRQALQTVTITASRLSPSAGIDNPVPLPNPLHSYATYTYGITLYILTKEGYNKLVDNPSNEDWLTTGAYSLISSGGGAKPNRHPVFQDDFYFDSLSMKTVIGMNKNTRGTNAIELNFSIIEPYGLTLLDRLLDVANDPRIGAGQNYVAQPYLLEVKFFGANDLGEMSTPIPNLTKHIPIRLLGIKIKVGSKGSEYQINAVPWTHSAFSQNNVSTPANFEIKATTVGDFFDTVGSEDLAAKIAEKKSQREEAELAKAELDNADRFDRAQITNKIQKLQSSINAPYLAESYAGAWNAWQQKVADDKHVNFANKIKFNIASDAIASSPIVDPNKMSYSRSNFSIADAKTAQQSQNTSVSSTTPTTGFDTNKMLFNITSGTSVIDVINLVMRNSDFIKKQVLDPLSDKVEFKDGVDVQLYKIIPTIKLLDFDPYRNDYAKETTFHILPYSYKNTKEPNLPKSKITGAVKEYNYIYSGKNIDIIDMAIDFDSAYYTAKIVNRDNVETTSAAVGAADELSSSVDRAKKPAGAGTITPNIHDPQSVDQSVAATGADTAKSSLVATTMKSLYSSARGDMLNIKVKIIGDPHFIKQDDLFINPGDASYDIKKQMINEGSLNLDGGDVYVRLNFKTPVDMDDATGLPRYNSRYANGGFTGFYKVLQVDNEFRGGQFVQTLNIVRSFDDPATAGLTNSTTGSADRQETQSAEINDSLRELASRQAGELGYNDEGEDPADADSVQEDNTDNNDENNDEDVEREEIDQDEDDDSELTEAEKEGQDIAGDLEGAQEVDSSTQRNQDASSPEPQNTPATPPTAAVNSKEIGDIKAKLADNERSRNALAAQIGPATDAAQEAYNRWQFHLNAGQGATYSSGYTATFNGITFTNKDDYLAALQNDFQAKADKRKALATEFNALFPIKTQLESDLANASGSAKGQ